MQLVLSIDENVHVTFQTGEKSMMQETFEKEHYNITISFYDIKYYVKIIMLRVSSAFVVSFYLGPREYCR